MIMRSSKNIIALHRQALKLHGARKKFTASLIKSKSNTAVNKKSYSAALIASIATSILSLLLLSVQTVIIFRQTDLLAGQTEAAQFDQADKIRLRMQDLVKLTQRLGDTQQFFQELATPDLGCVGPCRNQLLSELIPALRGRQFRFDGLDEARAKARLESRKMLGEMGDSFELYVLWVRLRLTLPRILGTNEFAYFPLAEMAEQAAVRCDVTEDEANAYNNNIKQLLPWFWLQHSADPDIERSLSSIIYNSFPKGLDESAPIGLKSSKTATLDDLNTTMKFIGAKASTSLGIMIKGCQKRIRRHLTRLREIEGS